MPILALLLVALGAPYGGSVDDAKEGAEAVADSFLRLVDAGKLEKTWDSAATLMKKQVTREQWRLAIEAGRAGTGNVQSRTRDASRFTEILPNVPDGTYVLVDYRGDFEKQWRVRERVITVFENGAWRVCGYFMNYDPEKTTHPARQ